MSDFEPGRSEFRAAVRRAAAKDHYGFADIDDVAKELGVDREKVGQLVHRYRDDFEWQSTPVGKLRLR